MYEQFYGLLEPPFGLTPNPQFFFPSGAHERAYEQVKYGVDRGEGFMIVYGNIGTGKTTLCQTLLSSVPKTIYAALVSNPFLSETDLLWTVLRDFGVLSEDAPRSGQGITKHDLITILNQFLLSVMQLNGRAVLVVDDAQEIPLATLEQIRILSNLETDKQKLIQIVLVGRPELKDVLRRPELRQLSQRVSIQCELDPFDTDETASYIQHRLQVASGGKAKAAFTPEAIDIVQRYSQGIPRAIHIIADACLKQGYAHGAWSIEETIVRKALGDLEIDRKGSSLRRLLAWARRQ